MSQDILQLLGSKREISEIVKEFQVAFNKVLHESLAQKARESVHLPPLAQATLASNQAFSLREFTMRGGKRIRPLIFCCGYVCADGKDEISVLKASVAIELLQTGLIIHDDVIDRSVERRQGPTMHLLWRDRFHEECSHARYPSEPEHFGLSMAVLMGDISSALAYEILVNAAFPAEHKLRAIHTFSDVTCRVAFGELLDVDLGTKTLARLTEPEILEVYALKTAGYTTEGPLHIGAVLGGAGPQQLHLLSEYAIPLGIAFQIQDDLLGMFGDRSEIGKDTGSDLIEAKRTPLLLKAWQESSSTEREFLEDVLSSPDHARQGLQQARELIARTGALHHTQELIAQSLQKVRLSIQEIGTEFGLPAAHVLSEVADYIEDREDYREAIKRYAESAHSGH